MPRRCRAISASLTTRSRYNRFFGAISELPKSVLDHFVHVGEDDRFSVVATMTIDGFETIVGEARYAFDADTDSFEFGLSIDDRWQGQGIGSALLEESAMPRRRVRRQAPVRRYPALQRCHDRARPQIRLCLHAQSRRLEAGALRKADRCSRRRRFPAPAGGWRRNRWRLRRLFEFRRLGKAKRATICTPGAWSAQPGRLCR